MITLPAGFEAAIDPHAIRSRNVYPALILQIGGLPSAYVYAPDNIDFTPATFWEGEDDRIVPAAVKHLFRIDDKTGFPLGFNLSGTELDVLNGRCDMGTLSCELDCDDELVALQATERSTGWRRLSVSVGAWQTELELEDASGISAGNVLYVDREAVYVESVSGDTLTVVRGWYGSTPARHSGAYKPNAADPSNPLPNLSEGRGAIVTTYPRYLDELPVTLWYGLSPTKLSDCVRVFAGQLRNLANEGLGVGIYAEDGQARLVQPLFWNIGEGWYVEPSTKGPNQPRIGDRLPAGPDRTLGAISIGDAPPNSILRQADQPIYVMIGSYIWWGRTTAVLDFFQTNIDFVPLRRDVWATTFKYEGGIRPVAPVILVSASSSDTSQPESDLPWLEEHVTNLGTVSGYHPLMYLLQLLTSTGYHYETGLTTQQNSAFDTLPTGWGLGIPADQIDIDGIVALALSTPELRTRLVVTDVVENARDWITENLLRPFGLYLAVTSDGAITVGSLQALSPDQLLDLPTIEIADLTIEPGTKQLRMLKGPTREGRDRVASVKLIDTPCTADGRIEFRRERTITVTEEMDQARAADPIEIETTGLVSDDELPEPDSLLEEGQKQITVRGEMPDNDEYKARITTLQRAPGAKTGREYIARLLSILQARFNTPSHKLTVKVRPGLWALGIGDRVSVSIANLVNPFSPVRGWSGVVCEITRRTVTLLTGEIELELSTSLGRMGNARFVAPCMKVVSWNAGTLTATVESNRYAPVGSYDSEPFIASPTVGTGWTLQVQSAERLQRSQTVQLVAKTDTTVTFSEAPVLDLEGRAPAAGDVITLAMYPDALPIMKSRYAYRCNGGSNPQLGSGDAPHRFS